MAKKNLLLVIDGVVNLILGMILMFFPVQFLTTFILPKAEPYFYVNIPGAVIFGIGMTLLLERFVRNQGGTSLGIGGAIIINLCGSGRLFIGCWLET